MPRLSELGTIWASGALLLLLAAIFFRAEAALWLASAAIFGLTIDLLLALPLGRRARAAGLELSWRISESAPDRLQVRGAPIRVEGSIVMREPSALRLVALQPVAPDHIKFDMITESLDLADREPSRIELTVRSECAGRSILQGLATRAVSPLGAFVIGLYFPHPLEIRAAPRALPWPPREARARQSIVPRDGSSAARARGPGVELYELREYRPGDPLRSIASVASARRGKLLVRETERPYEEEHLILLDLGAEMHSGPAGARPLDQAVDAIWTLLGELNQRSHRVRLVFFDDAILGDWSSDAGFARARPLRSALLGVFERYDRARIEGGEEEVAALVADHLRDQEARFHATSTAGDRARLASALRPRVRSLLRDPEAADSFEILLAYCRRFGLQLPPKALVPSGAREETLRAILLGATRRSRLHSIHLFSGLDAIPIDAGFGRLLSLGALRGRLTLYTPGRRPQVTADGLHKSGQRSGLMIPLKGGPDAPLPAALRRAFTLEREEEIRAAGALFHRRILSP